MCKMERGYNPALRGPRQYLAPLKMQLEGFWRADPIPVPELAVLVAVMDWLGRYARDVTIPGEQAKGYMGIVAFSTCCR